MADTFTTGNASVSFGSDLQSFYSGFLFTSLYYNYGPDTVAPP